MDEGGIGLVLARAFELRSKITNCIHKSSSSSLHSDNHSLSPPNQDENGEDNDFNRSSVEADDQVGGEEEETGRLLNILDAFELLETQLSSLQVIQQQQWYEREAALSEIDYSRKKLLKKLKEYKGENLEVIHEAKAFVSEAVEEKSDLLLPPYPSRPTRSLVSSTGYLSHFPFSCKSVQNGVINGDSTIEAKNSHLPDRNESQSGSSNSSKGFRVLINSAAKAAITVVGVISVLSLAGVEIRLGKKDTPLNVFRPFQTQTKREVQCPPGKVPVVENGEFRCLVKERIEIPFESVVATPDVNIGCG